MRTHIDWITFTMAPRYGAFDASNMTTGEQYATAIEYAWHATFDAETLAKAFGGNWTKNERSRAPYTDAWTLPETGITLFAGISLTHCCVEISGEGCERLIRQGTMENILRCVKERVTRLDVACDIETDVEPKAFAEMRKHKKFQSDGYQNSRSGKTIYIGSKKSDRFARVYRYSKPHPRYHLLRVEHVFHKETSRKVASEILLHGIDAVAFAAGETFGWSHGEWKPKEVDGADLSIVSAERNGGKTVFWLTTSVAMAFKRLCREGVIKDAQAFLDQFFLSGE